jgi:hypothetical protein
VPAYVARLGTFSIGWGVAEEGARPRYTVGHSSAGEVFERRFKSQERLVKTSSCSSLNRPEGADFHSVAFLGGSGMSSRNGASLPARDPRVRAAVVGRRELALRWGSATRKIRRGRPRVFWRGPEDRNVPPIPRARLSAVGRCELALRVGGSGKR